MTEHVLGTGYMIIGDKWMLLPFRAVSALLLTLGCFNGAETNQKLPHYKTFQLC